MRGWEYRRDHRHDNDSSTDDHNGDPTTTDAAVPSTDAPTTTTSAPEPVMFTERGPYGVGIATLDLGDRLADVYYPAIPELDAQTEIFDSLSVFPEELQVFIPDELTGEFDTTAYRDALVVNDEQAFPVLVVPRLRGFRQTSTFHLSHVASWGFVAITTDHLSAASPLRPRARSAVERRTKMSSTSSTVLMRSLPIPSSAW